MERFVKVQLPGIVAEGSEMLPRNPLSFERSGTQSGQSRRHDLDCGRTMQRRSKG